jgi:hypothetical protein
MAIPEQRPTETPPFQLLASRPGLSRLVSCPLTGSAMAASRLRAPFHSSAGRAFSPRQI